MKKAQAWSMDVMIAVIFFLIIIGAIIYISFFLSHKEKMDKLKDDADIIYKAFSSEGKIKIIDDSKINVPDLNNITNKDYESIKEEIGVKNDFCVYFVDDKGNLVYLDESNNNPGIGSSRITINGKACK